MGYAGWKTLNSESYDFNLRFSSSNARRLEAMLPADEARDFPLVSCMRLLNGNFESRSIIIRPEL